VVKKQTLIIIASILLVLSLVIAGEIIIYSDKEITLTKEQKDALATKNLTNYEIEDYATVYNGQARTSRCIMKGTATIRCFNVINGDLKENEILALLDEKEIIVMQQEADSIIKQSDKTKTKIGQGKTTVK
jgi:hypothetical protein